jgi:hypothetical protein
VSARDYGAEFRDPDRQAKILISLFLEGRPLSYTELATLLETEVRLIVGNCGELRAKCWIAATKVDGTTRLELTVPGMDVVRQLHLNS